MINQVRLDHFGPLAHVHWPNLGKINLVIGGNGSGKTFLLKAIYSSLRTLEEYKRGQEQRADSEILAEKLYWTFQTEKIGDLVSKGANAPLSSTLTIDHQNFSYSFGKDTSKQIASPENHVPPRASNSAWLPCCTWPESTSALHWPQMPFWQEWGRLRFWRLAAAKIGSPVSTVKAVWSGARVTV